MSDEILAKLDSLQAGQEAIRQDLSTMKSATASRFDTLESRFDTLESRFDTLESRSDVLERQLVEIRREANERQKIHLQILEALTGSRPGGLRQAG